jgi:hypothetical protein
MARARLKVVGDFGQSGNSVHGLGSTSLHGPFLYGKIYQTQKTGNLAGLGFMVTENHQVPRVMTPIKSSSPRVKIRKNYHWLAM